MRNVWKQLALYLTPSRILVNFSSSFNPVFRDRMVSVKDEKKMKEGQIQVLHRIILLLNMYLTAK